MITERLIEDYLTACRAAGLSPQTLRPRRDLLRRLSGRDLTAADVAAFLATPGWRPETRASYYGHARGFFRWACDEGHIEVDPMARMKRPKAPRGLPRPVTDEQLSTALRRADATWRLIITLAAYAGLRRTEIATLERGAVDRDQIRIVGKGGRTRIVPTHPAVWALVAPLGPGLVVTSPTGEPFRRDMLSMTARRLFDAWGLPDVTLHRFRHWFASRAYSGGGRDLLALQQLLGHSSPATTAVYALVDVESRRAAVAALPLMVAA